MIHWHCLPRWFGRLFLTTDWLPHQPMASLIHRLPPSSTDCLPHQVANLHRATVKAALEIVGALGVESPSMVSGKHLYRRDSGMRSPQP